MNNLRIVLALVLVACIEGFAKSSEATPADSLLVDSLSNGRQIYADRCAACHRLYAPEKRTVQQWGRILDRMVPKAKLDSVEELAVRNYLYSAAKK